MCAAKKDGNYGRDCKTNGSETNEGRLQFPYEFCLPCAAHAAKSSREDVIINNNNYY